MRREQKLDIKTDRRTFFRQYVELLQPLLKIRNREADVFGELLYHTYLKKSISNKTDKFKLVFDSDTRIEIEKKLDISAAVLRNALTQLRDKNLIVNNQIPDLFLVDPESEFSLTFKFNIQDEE